MMRINFSDWVFFNDPAGNCHGFRRKLYECAVGQRILSVTHWVMQMSKLMGEFM